MLERDTSSAIWEVRVGLYVNGERLQIGDGEKEVATELAHSDVISLGQSHINTYVFMTF